MLRELSDLGIKLNGRTSGSAKVTCPQCSASRKHSSDPCLSVDIDEGVYMCHNCGWHGSAGKKSFVKRKEYKLPEINKTALSDDWVSWFEKRKISKATIIRYGITQSDEWSEAAKAKVSCINFNYFRDSKLVNIKYRNANKGFKMAKDAELIFYGMDVVNRNSHFAICEGEMDALSLHEAGIWGVVSVPNGASKGSQKLEYLDNTWQFFEGVERINLATDNDEAGISLREALATRLGKDRCWIVDYPEGCKDANEVLMQHGKAVLTSCVVNARPYPLDGVITVLDVEDRFNKLYLEGNDRGKKIGFETFDQHITWKEGEFTLVTGIPGSGKSEFIDQVVMKLAELHGWRWGIFSPENQPEEQHMKKMAEKLIGKPCFAKLPGSMDESEFLAAKDFINEHMYFVGVAENDISVEGILEKMRQLVLRYGIKGFILDPWNYIEHAIPKGYTETQYISEALTKISRFCKLYKVHGIVIAHPVKIRKNEATGKYNIATLYDISGSANFFNKCDNGLSVYRHFDTGVVEVYVQKIRHKYIGKLGYVVFKWQYHNGRYEETVIQHT